MFFRVAPFFVAFESFIAVQEISCSCAVSVILTWRCCDYLPNIAVAVITVVIVVAAARFSESESGSVFEAQHDSSCVDGVQRVVGAGVRETTLSRSR